MQGRGRKGREGGERVEKGREKEMEGEGRRGEGRERWKGRERKKVGTGYFLDESYAPG